MQKLMSGLWSDVKSHYEKSHYETNFNNWVVLCAPLA